MEFQSTLLMRGATMIWITVSIIQMIFQSTLLMRGATIEDAVMPIDLEISIHAPHARSDVSLEQATLQSDAFQSTLLMRGATIGDDSMYCPKCGFQSTLLMRGATGS